MTRPSPASSPSSGPPSMSLAPPEEQSTLVVSTWLGGALMMLVRRIGNIAFLLYRSVAVLFRRPWELREIVLQMESIGVKSTGLVCITGTFVGMVMALQFAIGLQKFGGMEYTGRIVALSFSRELAPTLTAVIVGGRIGAGIAAEIGSMVVTEQVDAILALGADPVKKLVMPRLVASILMLPMLSMFSLVLGFAGAMAISSLQFGIPAGFFYHSALDTIALNDFWNGYLKTPFFGAIIALVGCHYGLDTSGGTQGVGRATTHTVVVVSVSILIADFFMTTLFSALLVR